MSKTYFLHDGHLGDCWAYMAWLLTREGDDRCTKVVSPNSDRVDFYRRIYNLMDTDGSLVFEVSKEYDQKIGKRRFLVDCIYPRTKITYECKTNIICYTFDANSFVDRKIPPNISKILQVESFKNYKFVDVGLPLTLEDSIKLLSSCKIFVGVDNGLSHVARSVGCPSFLVEYLFPITNAFPYEYFEYHHCYGVDDTIRKMKKFLS